MASVLVLEDDQDCRRNLQLSLEHKGLSVRAVASEEEAKNVIRTSSVGALVVSARLASGGSGLDFAAWARQQRGEIALIVMTNCCSQADERRSRELGAIGYLEKPVDADVLGLYVQRAIDHGRLLRELHRLEQELAQVREGDFLSQTVLGLPLACLSEEGEVLYASPEGQTVLESLVDPADPRPVQRVDADLLRRLRRAADASNRGGQIEAFRRDGVLAHHLAFVRRLSWSEQAVLVAFFMEAEQACEDGVGNLLLKLMLNPSVNDSKGTPRGAAASDRLQVADGTDVSRLSTAGQIISGIAHELTQPLTAIMGCADMCKMLIRSADYGNEQIPGNLDKLVSHAERAGQIIERLRQLVKQAKPRTSEIDINETIRDVIAAAANDARADGVEIRLTLEEPLPLVSGDAVQLQQVLMNLTRNALEEMRVTEAPAHRLTIRSERRAGGTVEVIVSDTGRGIPAKLHERVFDQLFTTKQHGLGIGLALSRAIIEAHGGQLWTGPHTAGGAVFRFTLPALTEQPRDHQPVSEVALP